MNVETNLGAPESSASYIRAGRALLVMLIVALAVSGYIYFVIYGLALGPRSWGRGLGLVVGGALSIVAVPAVVIVPWRLIQKRFKAPTNNPIVIGIILLVISVYFSLMGAMSEIN